ESMKSTMDMVLWYLPGLMTLSSLMYVGLGWLVLGHYSKPHDRLPSVTNFLDWKINFSFLITLTALFVIRLLAGLMEIDALNQALDNSLLVIGALFTLGGMSLSKWFLKRIKAPLIIRIIFYLALALSLHLGMIFLAVLGIIDTQFDLRKRINQPELS
ncbi:MAG: DUF2232 domain-containing protein, partial [candidate division Zixibacteria bacterium]|nr:DUF2232 domain-containing protein [candidate division Zixibacteria bacterium]